MRPPVAQVIALVFLIPASNILRDSSAYSKNNLPYWVSTTFLPCFSNRDVPNSFSNYEIAWLKLGWVIDNFCAALV